MAIHSQIHWWDRLEEIHNQSRDQLTRRDWHQAIRVASTTYTKKRNLLQSQSSVKPSMQLVQHGYYGVMHAFMIQAIAAHFDLFDLPFQRLIDVGCNTGVTGLTLCAQIKSVQYYLGVEPQRWAARWAEHLHHHFVPQGEILTVRQPRWRPEKNDLILFSFSLNEMSDAIRHQMKNHLLAHLQIGAAILIVEPIARSITPWWASWRDIFSQNYLCLTKDFEQP